MGDCSKHATISKASRSAETNEINEGIDTDTDDRSTSSTWVKNLSDKPLTEAQEQLLAHRPNFNITPDVYPMGNTLWQLNMLALN